MMKSLRDYENIMELYAPQSQTRLNRSPEAAARQSKEKMKFSAEQSEIILIETSSAVHPQFSPMMGHLLPILQTQGRPAYVCVSTVKELKKIVDNPGKPEDVRQRAEAVLHQLVKWEMAGQVRILGKRSDRVFADPKLINQVALLRHRVDAILVVTNDYKLSDDLLAQQVPDSGTIRTVQINRYGYFSNIPTPSRRVIRIKPKLNDADNRPGADTWTNL